MFYSLSSTPVHSKVIYESSSVPPDKRILTIYHYFVNYQIPESILKSSKDSLSITFDTRSLTIYHYFLNYQVPSKYILKSATRVCQSLWINVSLKFNVI